MRTGARVAKLARKSSAALIAAQDGAIVGVLNAAEWPGCQMRPVEKLAAAPTMIRAGGIRVISRAQTVRRLGPPRPARTSLAPRTHRRAPRPTGSWDRNRSTQLVPRGHRYDGNGCVPRGRRRQERRALRESWLQRNRTRAHPRRRQPLHVARAKTRTGPLNTRQPAHHRRDLISPNMTSPIRRGGVLGERPGPGDMRRLRTVVLGRAKWVIISGTRARSRTCLLLTTKGLGQADSVSRSATARGPSASMPSEEVVVIASSRRARA